MNICRGRSNNKGPGKYRIRNAAWNHPDVVVVGKIYFGAGRRYALCHNWSRFAEFQVLCGMNPGTFEFGGADANYATPEKYDYSPGPARRPATEASPAKQRPET